MVFGSRSRNALDTNHVNDPPGDRRKLIMQITNGAPEPLSARARSSYGAAGMKRRARSEEPFEVKRRDSSREWLEARFAAVPDLDVRRLFSGAGLYSADVIFGIYFHGRLYFKVDANSVGEFLSRGSEPFCPRPGQTLGRYYEVPLSVADDDDELLVWARRAVVAAQSPSQTSSASPRQGRAPRKKAKARAAKKRPA
jgi:DNA transformation protein and related proteins